MKKISIAIFIVSILIVACSKKSDSVPSTANCTTAKSFVSDVNPIIQTTCALNAGCHANGSTNGPGPLTSYAQVFNARVNIKTAVSNGTMPQNSSLSTDQKNAIICWIDSGAPNN